MPTIAATKDAVPDEVAQSATTTNSGSEANPTSNNGNDMTSNTNTNTNGNGTYANEEDDPEFPLRQKSFKLLHEAGDCLKHCHIVLQRLLEYAPPLAIPENVRWNNGTLLRIDIESISYHDLEKFLIASREFYEFLRKIFGKANLITEEFKNMIDVNNTNTTSEPTIAYMTEACNRAKKIFKDSSWIQIRQEFINNYEAGKNKFKLGKNAAEAHVANQIQDSNNNNNNNDSTDNNNNNNDGTDNDTDNGGPSPKKARTQENSNVYYEVNNVVDVSSGYERVANVAWSLCYASPFSKGNKGEHVTVKLNLFQLKAFLYFVSIDYQAHSEAIILTFNDENATSRRCPQKVFEETKLLLDRCNLRNNDILVRVDKQVIHTPRLAFQMTKDRCNKSQADVVAGNKVADDVVVELLVLRFNSIPKTVAATGSETEAETNN